VTLISCCFCVGVLRYSFPCGDTEVLLLPCDSDKSAMSFFEISIGGGSKAREFFRGALAVITWFRQVS